MNQTRGCFARTIVQQHQALYIFCAQLIGTYMVVHNIQDVTLVTCKNCGWVHVACSRTDAEKEVRSFNEYFDTLSPKKRLDYGNKHASIKSYEHCFRCGGSYNNFRAFKSGDCPDGCTLQSIIEPETAGCLVLDDTE